MSPVAEILEILAFVVGFCAILGGFMYMISQEEKKKKLRVILGGELDKEKAIDYLNDTKGSHYVINLLEGVPQNQQYKIIRDSVVELYKKELGYKKKSKRGRKNADHADVKGEDD